MKNRNEKFLYIWRLSRFLYENGKTMSGEELAMHLNRNEFKTSYGTEYEGGRGTYRLVAAVWEWLQNDLKLSEEAKMVASSFVNSENLYAFDC